MKQSLRRFLDQKGSRENPIEPFIPEQMELVPLMKSKRAPRNSKYLYAYIRVSTSDQFKSGLGIESQFHEVAAYIEKLRAEQPQWAEHKFAGVYVDAPTSSVKHDLRDRKVGKVLCERLRPGDGVVFLKYDRAFRNFRHMLNQKHEWDNLGIHMLFMDLQLDLSTAMGSMMLHMYGIIAEVEAKNTSERTKAALHAKKARGDKLGTVSTAGMVIVRSYNKELDRRTSREYIRHDLMPIVRLVAFYRETFKMTFAAISDRIEALQAKREKRPPTARIHFSHPRRWTEGRVKGAYRTWVKIVEDGRRLNWWEHSRQPEEVGMFRGEPFLTIDPDRKIPPAKRA